MTGISNLPIVLGSRSPRRLELLRLLVPDDRIVVCPPLDVDEAGFEGLNSLPEFERRILEIAHAKAVDVLQQIASSPVIPSSMWQSQKSAAGTECIVLVADTTVIVTAPDGCMLSLGQPPGGPEWVETVRMWFRSYFAGQTHDVLSGVAAVRVRLGTAERTTLQRVCHSSVTMRPDVERWLDWYLSTDEPLGKAGGYAIQGAASVFVTRVEGSYSNIVGLPLAETFEMLSELSR